MTSASIVGCRILVVEYETLIADRAGIAELAASSWVGEQTDAHYSWRAMRPWMRQS